jgi:hypothetical protein
LDEPFEPEPAAPPPEACADELRLRDDAALPLRDDADDARRVDAPALFGLLRDAAALFGLLRDAPALFGLLREAADLLFDEPRLLLPEPFELRLPCFLLLDERVLASAIAPP